MEVSGWYLPVLSPLLSPGTILAAPEPGYPHAALTLAPPLLSVLFLSGVAAGILGDLRISGQNLHAFGKGAQKSSDCRRTVTIRPPRSEEMGEEFGS